jgi:hypothetical protein
MLTIFLRRGWTQLMHGTSSVELVMNDIICQVLTACRL